MKKVNCYFILLGIFSFASARAQVTTGSIVGTARDASGAVLPRVNLTLTNQRTNATRTTAADDRGDYGFPALSPSEYTIKAEAKGFKSSVTSDVTLPLGAEIRVDLNLQVGDVSEQVSVTAEAPLLQSESSALSHVVSQQQIVNLPLNGR